jgi:hypothetical protein
VLLNMAPAAVALQQQQQRVHWLPASWTVGIMSAFLGITSFMAVNVPDSYMVFAEVTQPVSIVCHQVQTRLSKPATSNIMVRAPRVPTIFCADCCSSECNSHLINHQALCYQCSLLRCHCVAAPAG